MKYNPIIFHFLSARIKTGLQPFYPKEIINRWIAQAKPIYKHLLTEIHGVSDNNPMANNITTSFVFIAIWLASDRIITPEQMSEAAKTAVDMKIMRKIVGMIDMNTEKGIALFGKMMHKNAEWAEAHPEDNNTWDFHFDENLHKDGFYYYFNHCPIADFCKEHGYEKINPVLCNIDFTTMAMMHSVLHREHTVAEGAGICDYWSVGDQVENPQ